MKCDWIFIDNGLKEVEKVTLAEPGLPRLGDGKRRNDQRYKVTDVIERPASRKNPSVIAAEVDELPVSIARSHRRYQINPTEECSKMMNSDQPKASNGQ